jgi:hypothetical protein
MIMKDMEQNPEFPQVMKKAIDDRAHKPGHDPIEDEKKEYTMSEFSQVLRDSVEEYREVLEGANEFTRGKHTFNEWVRAFLGFMSW